MVLGTAQDGGVPQTGCQKSCCEWARAQPNRRRMPACLALIDPQNKMRWVIDCTPDFPAQLALLNNATDPSWGLGLLLTHAHMGHYVGLVHLGREVMGADRMPVYCMPQMAVFLKSDAPWRQLVTQGHIEIKDLVHEQSVQLSSNFTITPIQVPHRGEISEAVCFKIESGTQAALHLPDIDNWEQWDKNIEEVLTQVDVAWLDGTFFNMAEVGHRDASVIPHPSIETSLARLAPLDAALKAKVRFTHLNHTNPACNSASDAYEQILAVGCQVAQEGETFALAT